MTQATTNSEPTDASGSQGLRARCARGGGTLAVGSAVERGARFLRNFILARMLVPDQFGLMAIVLMMGLLFEALTEVGVRQSIVQNRRGDTPEFMNVAWWFSAIRGFVIGLCGMAAAPWIAAFYDNPELTLLLRVAFISILLTGLASPGLYVLQKRLQFGRFVCVMQGAGLAGTAVSLVVAIFIPNVWALVIGFVSEAVFRCIASFVVSPFRPRLMMDRESGRQLLGFAGGMAGLPILTFVVMQADIFVLGKTLSDDDLGLYALAQQLASIPMIVFSRVAQPLMLPVLSGFQDDIATLRSTVLRITRTVFTFGIPMTVCMAVLGPSILSLAYGSQYAAMSAAFAWLCVYFLFHMLNTVFMATYLALGQPGLHRRFTIARAVLLALCIYPVALWLGPAGVAGTLLVCLLIASTLQLVALRRILGLDLRQYFATANLGLLLAALVVGPVLLVRLYSGWGDLMQFAAGVAVGALAWAIGAWRTHSLRTTLMRIVPWVSNDEQPPVSVDDSGAAHAPVSR